MDKDITTSRLEEYVELQKESFNAVEDFYLKMKQAYEDHSQESLEAALNTGEENLEKLGEIVQRMQACVNSIERLERSKTIREHVEENRIWLDDCTEEKIGEILFPEVEDGVVNITHTEVDPFYGGQGIAGALTKRAADLFRERGLKCVLSCSYAIKWFSQHPEYSDVLKDPEAEAEKAAMLAGPACSIRKER